MKASNKDLFTALIVIMIVTTVITFIVYPFLAGATVLIITGLLQVWYIKLYHTTQQLVVVDWYYSHTFNTFLLKTKDEDGNIRMILNKKPVHIGSILAIQL